MEYRKFSQGYVLRLDPGEEIVDGLTRLAEQGNIQLASVTGLGAANDITVGIFNNAEKQFQARHCQGEYEIASLVGSITRKDGEPYLHLHITFGSPPPERCTRATWPSASSAPRRSCSSRPGMDRWGADSATGSG